MSDLGRDLARALDPVATFRAAVGEPDPWQAEFLRGEHSRDLLLCARQTGKSTSTSVLATHEAVYVRGSLTLLLSPSLRQSSELFRKVMHAFNALGRPERVVKESALQLELANGSRVVSLPSSEDTIRCYSAVTLLIVDEASRVPDELFHATSPMLAVSNGKMVLLSTPKGRRGFFHREWAEGAGWRKVVVTAEQCPRISAEFLADERAKRGPRWYAQEYLCEFLAAEGAVFDVDAIGQAFGDPGVRPFFGGDTATDGDEAPDVAAFHFGS